MHFSTKLSHHFHHYHLFIKTSFTNSYKNHSKYRKPIIFFKLYPKNTHTYPLPTIQPSHLSTAYKPFDEMPQRAQHAKDTHFNFALNQLKSTSRNDFTTVMIFHCLAIKFGVLPHLLPISTLLLTRYSRAGDLSSSMGLFDEIRYKDVIFRNAMITAFIENKRFSLAMHLFLDVVDEGCVFDSTMLLLVVTALSHMSSLKQGRVVHGLSVKCGMLSDSSLCNALLNMYAKCGDLNSSECMFVGIECKDIVSWNSMMTKFLANNRPEMTLRYFEEMVSCGIMVDSVSLSCAISASGCLNDLGLVESIHGLVIKLGYTNSFHISIGNSLISSYSRCSEIEAAKHIFRDIMYKDVVSWNSMIHGFASNGMNIEALEVLSEMQFLESIELDMATLLTILPLLLLREGKSVHGYTLRRDKMLDISMTNSIIDMYSKYNEVMKARLLFNNMLERDLVSWNTMISGYSQNGHCREAQKLFKKLLYHISHYSLTTVLAILPSCTSHDSLPFGRSIQCWQLKLGFVNDIIAYNSIMNMYINCGDLMTAFKMFGRLLYTRRDLTCFNTIISGCLQNERYHDVLETFNLMRRESDVVHDSITLVGVITACGNLELPMEGKYLHGLALKSLNVSDTRVQNVLVTMYSRCGDIESAISVFRSSSNKNLCSWNCIISGLSQNKAGREVFQVYRSLEYEPNEITIVGLLSACTQLGVVSHGKQIHSHVLRNGFHGNSYVSSALMNMYSNCGTLETAMKIFTNTTEKSIVSWNSMISAYGFHGNGMKAIKLFHEMLGFGITPTKSTFISLLSACSHSGLIKEGLLYYNHMLDKYGVEPETEHQVCIVDMLGRSGKHHEAYEFVKKLPLSPKPGVWGAMLSACNYHEDTELGKEVAELLFEMEPENAVNYIALANMYVAGGRWKEAGELRDMVEDKRLRKSVGYSLIDVCIG